MSEFYLRRMLYPVFACSRPQCFLEKLACACKKQRKLVSVFHWLYFLPIKKKPVQSGIQNKGKITIFYIMIILYILGTNVLY